MNRSPLEKKIQADIELALGSEPDLILMRNSIGQASYFDEDSGKSWSVPYGVGGKGAPDLVGILKLPMGLGVWFCIEVKQPGKSPTPEQKKIHALWRRFGAFVFVCTSVVEARAALNEARSVARAIQ